LHLLRAEITAHCAVTIFGAHLPKTGARSYCTVCHLFRVGCRVPI
jgi:hypothetical protein